MDGARKMLEFEPDWIVAVVEALQLTLQAEYPECTFETVQIVWAFWAWKEGTLCILIGSTEVTAFRSTTMTRGYPNIRWISDYTRRCCVDQIFWDDAWS